MFIKYPAIVENRFFLSFNISAIFISHVKQIKEAKESERKQSIQIFMIQTTFITYQN